MHYIGLDLSLTGTGVVVLKDNSKKPIVAKCIKTKNLRGGERLAYIWQEIHQILDMGWESAVVIEGYSYGSINRGLPFQIGELGGVVRERLTHYRLLYTVVPPTTLKKFITGHGNAKKPEVMKIVQNRWGFETKDNNIADAYGLAMYAKEMTK